MSSARLSLALVLLAVGCGAHGSEPASPVPHPAATHLSLRLYHGIGMIAGYDYASILPRLRALAPGDAVATIDERDVAQYRTAAERSGKVEIVLTEAATRRVLGGRTVDELCAEGPFVVYLDDQFVYGGQCYPRIGAAGLQYPVAHLELRDGSLVLGIYAFQGASFTAGPHPGDVMDPPPLRTLFDRLGRRGAFP